MSVRWLLDSDAAICLCKYVLVDDLARALGVPLMAICVLPQLRYQLHLASKEKALKKLGSELAFEQACRLVETAQEVSVLVSSANQALLAATPDIDGGELALFAALLDSEQSGLITGDKRALVALSRLDGEPTEVLWARLLCLEDAIALLVQRFGHSYVSAKIRPRLDANMALSIAFGRVTASDASSTAEGLNSYLRDLNLNTRAKYIPRHVLDAASS